MEKQEIKLKGSIFLSVKELMILTGKNSYKSAQREHQAIRDSICEGKRKLTIREYCDYERIIFVEIIQILNENR